ncbi:hypothetical protein BD408DRAFT_26964 [Parasitella parasitica]|nr:hypothetical protein BD408DRAFT_26964 [Parasitella parasitica]
MQAISSQTDDYIRHRMSDMSVSQHPSQRQYEPATTPTKTLSPLEPSSQQSYYEPLSYSRRGSVTDPAAFHNHSFRRPSITDMSNLPLPTSTVVSRRGSIATTDYDYSSRSSSPSPFSSSKRYHENDAAAPHPYALNNGRRDSLPNNYLPLHHHPSSINTTSAYDPYQRRHSIATAEPTYNHGNRNSAPSSTKYRAFKFPATIQESPNYRTFSAPPSPPQSALGNVGHQELMHENKDSKYNGSTSRKNSISRLSYTPNGSGGGPMLPSRRRPSILDDLNDGPSAEHLLVRRASMPVVPSLHRNQYDRSNIPPPPPLSQQQQQQSRLHELRSGEISEPCTNRHGSMSDSMMEEEKRKETPYSRSPELRISHKLAERKRRKEMKDLFDELRDSLPVEKNMKTSKWEILSKAVEYISLLKRRDYDMEVEISGLRREIDMIKRERANSSNYGPPFA